LAAQLSVKRWLNCDAGRLAAGEAEFVSKRKLGFVAIEMCRKWHTLPVGGISRHFLKAYGKLSSGEGTWDEVRTEMPDTPFGVASLGQYLAWDVSQHLAKDSVAKLWKNATSDDKFWWGFGGPPNPQWQSTHKTVIDQYPSLLREIVGNPFRSASINRCCNRLP
jgi:hypothetical protein